ncbi:unnamed protein product [Parnassius mnemosyne]|uniref:Reverse transcriptase domain-containing protein n=1 Tax=Parnassius mnemosyne TaxID=213953 RepID=A0AAV1L3I5_9NEOP
MSFDESDHNQSSSSFISASDVLSNDDSFESIPPLKDTLDSHFFKALRNFNIVHINAQSIPAHYPDMLASFVSDNVHAILVSESWLKPCLPSISYSIPGFQLIRNDRTARGGGGVAIYLRAHIPISIVRLSSQFPAENEAEYLFIEVLLSHNKLLIGVFYSPSSTVDYFTTLDNLLEELTPLYKHTVLMGDFNTCLLKNDARSLRLKSLIEAANLNILPLSETHFFPNCVPSLLDLVIVSSLDHVDKFGQCAANAFSYHDLLFLSYKIRPPKAKSRILLQRNFEEMDLEKLQKDAANMDWSVITKACSVDEQVALFNSFLVQLYDIHAPVRPVRIRHPPAPWLTEDLKRLIVRKNNAKSSYRSDPKNDRIREKYRLLRNQCNKLCRDLRRRHIHKSVQNEDPCRVWNFLRSIGVEKTRSCPISNNVDLNLLNKHFSSVSCLDNMAKSTTLTQLSSFPTPDFSPFVFRQFADCDVRKHILSIHSDAVGCDDVSRKMIIPLLDFLTPIITFILNFSISSSSFPNQWKDAQIILIPKKANPSSFSEYRPISILPFLSKVLERLVQQQINSFCLRNNILNPFQSGFRSGHSTTTALLKITDDIRHGMENHQVTLLVLLDFSNAFNTVDHDILLGILRSLNISPTAITWFHSYLYGRRQRIRVHDRLSSWLDTVAGVPQGGVLSPLLFAIFINTITSQISSLYHLYADDLQIYLQTTIEDLPKAVECINKDLTCILDWSLSYGLTVNPLKSQAIIIGSPRMICKIKKCQLQHVVYFGVIREFPSLIMTLLKFRYPLGFKSFLGTPN